MGHSPGSTARSGDRRQSLHQIDGFPSQDLLHLVVVVLFLEATYIPDSTVGTATPIVDARYIPNTQTAPQTPRPQSQSQSQSQSQPSSSCR
jgi:hypothetical protein